MTRGLLPVSPFEDAYVPDPGPITKAIAYLSKPRYVMLLCAAVLFYRVPDTFINPQFYVEDGVRFFPDARQHGIASLFESWTNYLHLVPRLFAYIVSPIPARYAPAAYKAYALLAHIGVIGYLFSNRINLSHKPLMAFAIVLTPCLDNACIVNLTNGQWSLAQMMILLCISNDATTRGQKVFDLVLLLLTGMTGPFTTLFLPVFAYRAIVRKSRWSYALLAIVCCLTAMQLALVMILPWANGRPDIRIPFNLHDPNWHGVFGDSIVGVMVAGVNAPLIFENSWVLTVLSAGLFAGLLFNARVRRDSASPIFLFCGAAVLLAASVSWKSAPGTLVRLPQYHYLFRIMLSWALIQSLSTPGWQRIAAGVVLAWSALAALPGLQTPPALDLHWAEASRLVESPGEVEIPITSSNYLMILHNPESSKSATASEVLTEHKEWTTGSDGQPFQPVIFALKEPTYFCGVRIKYRLASLDGSKVTARIVWLNSFDTPPYPNKGFMDLASTDDKVEIHTGAVCGPIDHVYVLVDKKAVHFEIIQLERLY